MNFPKRLVPSIPEWAGWYARFPELPLPEEFALQWTLARLIDAKRGIPDPARLSLHEREVLRQWVADISGQFVRDQKPPNEGFDVNGGLGVVSGLAGIPAFAVAPPAGIALGAICVFTFVRKEHRRHVLNRRLRLAGRIELELGEIERMLR